MSGWRRWLGRAPAPSEERMVVVDTETTGLDPAKDFLLAVGAVALADGAIHLDDSFEITVRQPSIRAGPDILVHGIGVGMQRAGAAPAEAMDAFDSFAAGSPLVGFHAVFDQAIMRRAGARSGLCVERRWLDVADLAAVMRPDLASRCRSLDEWLSACGIDCDNRHNAAADAFATASLLAYLLPIARRQRVMGHSALRRAARSARWLGHSPR